jgi:hypothetical protein
VCVHCPKTLPIPNTKNTKANAQVLKNEDELLDELVLVEVELPFDL